MTEGLILQPRISMLQCQPDEEQSARKPREAWKERSHVSKGISVRSKVKGTERVKRNLGDLAKDLEGRDMAAALLEGARSYARTMKRLAPKRTGKLERGIYAFNKYQSDNPGGKGTRKSNVRLKDTQAMAISSAPHSHLVEFGTKPHRIQPKSRKRRAKNALLLEGGVIVGSVERQSARAHPFWRPALTQGADEATQAVLAGASKIVEKYE